jgi:hypothetical protein
MSPLGHPLRVSAPVTALDAWATDDAIELLLGGDDLFARVTVTPSAFAHPGAGG